MIHESVEFFNVAELEEVPGMRGRILARVPAAVRRELNPRARFIGRNSTGVEIRFVTEAPYINLTLGAIRNEEVPIRPEVKVMCGDFEHQRYPLNLDGIQTIHLTPCNFSTVNPKVLRRNGKCGEPVGFAPHVWRVVCSSPSIVFCGIETFGVPVRPPLPAEKPDFCCLCYGSSLTNSNIDGWPHVMAQRRGIEVLNLGLAGACQIEPVMIDFIASRTDWSGIILELGINIFSPSTEEFANRVAYALAILTKLHPGKPVVLLTMFPSTHSAPFIPEEAPRKSDAAFNGILREQYNNYRNAGHAVHLLEGGQLLDDYTGLSTDLLHPRNYGSALIGLRMAELLGDIFEQGKRCCHSDFGWERLEGFNCRGQVNGRI